MKRFVRWGILVSALLVAFSWQVSAQSDPYAFVIYAEGFNMSVYRNDELETYDVLVDEVIGMPLLPGDLVQTDADTFVEIQVMPSRTVVKVAENTTFEIESLGGAGGGSFNMSYGRLRARVERLTNNETFQVRGFSAVAGVRGTDFGYDMVVERAASEELQTRVYVFEGEVEVSEAEVVEDAAAGDAGDTDASEADGPDTSDGGGAAEAPRQPQSVLIRANEMVNVVSPVPAALVDEDDRLDGIDAVPGGARPPVQNVVFSQEPIQSDIQQFWTDRDFQEEAIDPDRVEDVFPGINARVERLTDERRQFEEIQRLRREGLLTTTDELLADAGAELEPPEPEREPEPASLGAPGSDAEIRRMIQPDQGEGASVQLRRAGHWMLGTGVALGAAGGALGYFVDGSRTVDDFATSGPSAGMLAGGGVFVTSALFSYLLSLVVD